MAPPSVWLTVPNLIGYVRLALLVAAVASAAASPPRFVSCWLLSSGLDLFDGLLARRLGQSSRLGEILDVACDNAARSVMWAAACAVRGPSLLPLATAVTVLEWLCFTSTQVSATMRGAGCWKEVQAAELPALVAVYFANNFVNPIGALGIVGLFGSPLFLYAEAVWPVELGGTLLRSVGVLLHAGRALSACVELFFIGKFFRMLASCDEPAAAQEAALRKKSC